MGDSLGKAVLFQAPSGPFQSSNVIWDEGPRGAPDGGVKRPFLWLERRDVKTTMIYFHGNAEDLMDVESDLMEISHMLRVNVLAVEYPGYGLMREHGADGESKAQASGNSFWSFPMCSRKADDRFETTIEGIDKAALHALTFVITRLGVPASQVILFGRSLGSGVALRLAQCARERFQWSVGAVVLQCPYISIRQVVSDYACSASSFLIPTYYDNLDTLKALCSEVPAGLAHERWVPLLILHGEQDEVVWPYHGHTLYEEAVKLGHPFIDAVFPQMATHNRWDLHEDIIANISLFLMKHIRRPDGAISDRPGCFGPGSRASRGHGGRSYGGTTCIGGRGGPVACMLGPNLLESVLGRGDGDNPSIV